jgi:hypothetical protein
MPENVHWPRRSKQTEMGNWCLQMEEGQSTERDQA